MSILKTGASAVVKLAALGVLVVFFIVGLAGVVLMSLQGTAIKVPEITGKSFTESEHELASLGLKIKRRADRVSSDPPNTVIEQLPKAGDTVKTGQLILVVTSRGGGGDDPTPILKKTDDDSDTIEEMITDKPKKPKANSNANTKKKADTTRDIADSSSSSDANSSLPDSNSNRKETGSNNNSIDKSNKNTSSPSNKQMLGTNRQTPQDGRTKPGGADTRPRAIVKP